MTQTFRNSAQAGQTNGTTQTVSNCTFTPYGDAPTSVTLGTTAGTHSTTYTGTGIASMYRQAAASGASSMRQKTGFSGSELNGVFSFTFDALPAAVTEIRELRSASARQAAISLSATGHIVVYAADGSTVLYTSTTALTAGTIYDIHWRFSNAGTTTSGTADLALYAHSAPSTILETAFSTTGKNIGTAVFTEDRAGKCSVSTATNGFFYANEYVSDTAIGTGTPGVFPNLSAPVANAGPDQTGIVAGTTVTLAGSGTNTPTSYAWTQTSGTTVTLSSTTSATPTFTSPQLVAGATLVFSLTATNGSGTSTADTVEIDVLPQIEWIANGAGTAWVPTKTSIL